MTITAHFPPFDTVDNHKRKGVVSNSEEAKTRFLYGYYSIQELRDIINQMEVNHGKKEEVK